MDETGLRALLDQVSNDELPPVRVDIELATRTGYRRLRWRRRYLPGAAPLAAAAAVALIVGLLSATGAGLHRNSSPSPAAPLRVVPDQFSVLRPYASFGWLPPGFTTDGLQNQSRLTTTHLVLSASSADGRGLLLAVNSGKNCKMTGTYKLLSGGGEETLPHALACATLAIIPLIGPARPVDGRPAYWGEFGPRVALVWEYGKNAWAGLSPGPSVGCLQSRCSPMPPLNWMGRPQLGGRPGTYPSEATLALLYKVAERVRFGSNPVVRYPFTIRSLPASWVADPKAENFVASIGGVLTNVQWMAGPAVDPSALTINVAPASLGRTVCFFGPGRSSYFIDGVRAGFSGISSDGPGVLQLCAFDVRGLQVSIELDVSIPGYYPPRELPGGHLVGDLRTLASHLRLLGPDPAHWSTQPPS
jgi:hypothetical protein